MATTALAQQVFNEAAYLPTATQFTLTAPDTATPVVKIYDTYDAQKPSKVVKMKQSPNGQWTATVKQDLKNKFYVFNINGKKGSDPRDTPGVFAKAVSVNGQRAAIIDPATVARTDWQEVDSKLPKLNSPADLVIYEMHHRDFSISPSSGITPANRGKYLALTEPKSIEYLQRLGVNAVHILPSFDYASVDEQHLERPQYNWGYDPQNYNVPEGSYSTDPYDPACRIKEFKAMVAALHNAGIRVILDVVYNHTFDIENSNFQKTYPNFYYRFRADGTPSDGSGCGNETASDQPLMRQFMMESMLYWVNEYHIDGFRVDLMGVHDILAMNVIRKALPKEVFVYGEGWSAGTCAYPQEKLAMKANISQMPGIAAFSDDMRDALRGPFSDDTKGAFLAGIAGQEESLKFGIVGAIRHPQVDMSKVNYSTKAWATEPTQQISYVSCHDDMCLVDRLRTSIPGIQDDELIRLDLLAQTAVLTSQGVPFILSGEEMLRNKKGVHNSYNSPDSINMLDWTLLQRYPQVFQYYSRLIKMRRAHPAFRLGNAEAVRRHLEFIPVSQPCVVAYRLKDHAGGDAWSNITVVLNANSEAVDVTVPQGDYTVVACDGTIDTEGLSHFSGDTVTVSPQSALIMHQE